MIGGIVKKGRTDKMRIIFTTLLFLAFTTCYCQTNKLFQIDQDNKMNHGFLYLVESLNIRPIPADSVRKFLNWDEIESTKLLVSTIYPIGEKLPKSNVFKNYGRIYSSKKFTAYMLLNIGNDSLGRDYRFIIRTYTHGWKIIDSYILAVWNEQTKEFTFGSISKNLIIERKREKSKVPENMQITKSGKIIITSYNKP